MKTQPHHPWFSSSCESDMESVADDDSHRGRSSSSEATVKASNRAIIPGGSCETTARPVCGATTANASNKDKYNQCPTKGEESSQNHFLLGFSSALILALGMVLLATSFGMHPVARNNHDIYKHEDATGVGDNVCNDSGVEEFLDLMVEAMKSGGVTVSHTHSVVDIMRAHSKVQKQGCQILRHLSEHHQDHRKEILDADGVEVIVGAMEHHPKDLSIQEDAIALLGMMASMAKTGDKESRSLLYSKGIDGIIRAMTSHLRDVDIQDAGCFAMTELTTHSDNSTRRAVSRSNASWAVQKAKMKHGKQAKICAKAEIVLPSWQAEGTPQCELGPTILKAAVKSRARVTRLLRKAKEEALQVLYCARRHLSAGSSIPVGPSCSQHWHTLAREFHQLKNQLNSTAKESIRKTTRLAQKLRKHTSHFLYCTKHCLSSGSNAVRSCRMQCSSQWGVLTGANKYNIRSILRNQFERFA